MNNIITEQRRILAEEINPAVSDVPQIFIPYKEVLTLYNNGVQVPDDVTLIWPDDNHGQMRQLPNAPVATACITTSPTGVRRRATCGWIPRRWRRSGRSCAGRTTIRSGTPGSSTSVT
jgi:hypothetical protein